MFRRGAGGGRPEVLFVSKPVGPPWHDSGKNLVKDIATGMARYCPRLLVNQGASFELPGAICEPLYPQVGSYSPSLKQNGLVLKRLLLPRGEQLRHFFFAPNKRTSMVGKAVSVAYRKLPTVQTVMSVPLSFDEAPSLLFSDAVVALSDYTRRELEARGVRGVSLIYPGVEMAQAPMAPAGDLAAQQALRQELGLSASGQGIVVTFAGDYQFSDAAFVYASAIERLLSDPLLRDRQRISFVFACRIKQEESRAIEANIRSRLAAYEASGQVIFLNEVPKILKLLAASTVVILPASSTYAKMDIPLVLVEAMREQRPVIVSDHGPLPEVVGDADVGEIVPSSQSEALAQAIKRYIDEPQRWVIQGEAARLRAQALFDSASLGASYERVYDDVLAAASRR